MISGRVGLSRPVEVADGPEPGPGFASDDQDWGVALLFSVQPTDRALAGHGLAGQLGERLRVLAAMEEERP